MAEEKFDLTAAFGDSLDARRKAYVMLQAYALQLKGKISKCFQALRSRDHVTIGDAILELGELSNEVRAFNVRAVLSSTYGKDTDLLKAADNMQRQIEIARKDAQTVATLFMNEYRNG
jgi:hypothetical protein